MMTGGRASGKDGARGVGWRHGFLLVSFATLAGVLIWRTVDLQVLRKTFLKDQGDARHLRVVRIAAHRGMITDRNGDPLAISTPVDSVWVDPPQFPRGGAKVSALARMLGLSTDGLLKDVNAHKDREFLYIKRQIPPALGRRVMNLDVSGVALRHEYRRFYPAAEVGAHVIGFTDIDDVGQAGLELAFNSWLRGVPGAKRVIKDRLGQVIQDVDLIRKPQPGHTLVLSLDRTIEYLAYRALKEAVVDNNAKSGALVLLDVRTGEVLAMASLPGFNPNNRADLSGSALRNRAVTDAYEPGSTMKPFTIAAALETGRYTPGTIIDTRPGTLRVGQDVVHDDADFGVIDVSTVIEKSSNVGAAKIALSLPDGTVWRMLSKVGFGAISGSGFPGESPGSLYPAPPRYPIDRATLAFGYGVAVTPLQLARAYAVIASGGLLRPVSFVKLDKAPGGKRVMTASAARAVKRMMLGVVSDQGTAPDASIPGYSVAGKTGTVRKSIPGGYSKDKYVAWFAGMAPASKPRLVLVVTVNEPRRGAFYGGLVAAPVFAQVMGGALRLLNIPPDQPVTPTAVVADAGGSK